MRRDTLLAQIRQLDTRRSEMLTNAKAAEKRASDAQALRRERTDSTAKEEEL
jgi:hypothetical protein